MERVQVLLTHEQVLRLRELARRQGTSVSALVREMIEEGLARWAETQKARRARLLRRIRTEREALQARYGSRLPTWQPEMLHRLREERLHDLMRP